MHIQTECGNMVDLCCGRGCNWPSAHTALCPRISHFLPLSELFLPTIVEMVLQDVPCGTEKGPKETSPQGPIPGKTPISASAAWPASLQKSPYRS